VQIPLEHPLNIGKIAGLPLLYVIPQQKLCGRAAMILNCREANMSQSDLSRTVIHLTCCAVKRLTG
jgi:hypothetical protein